MKSPGKQVPLLTDARLSFLLVRDSQKHPIPGDRCLNTVMTNGGGTLSVYNVFISARMVIFVRLSVIQITLFSF